MDKMKTGGDISVREKLGEWISNGSIVPFYARKEFILYKPVKQAVARVCGLGQFVFYVNGQKAGDHELDPGWTNYDKLIQYVTFDITPLLKEGQNVAAAEVGNGWYIKNDEHYTFRFPEFMPNSNPYRPFGSKLVFTMELEITYMDGSEEFICSDKSFMVRNHAITASNVYGSETVDGRLAPDGWNMPGFDDTGWENASVADGKDSPRGKLTEQFQPPVKVISRYRGKFLHKAGDREIYDLGQNISGILDVRVKGKAGEYVKIYPAEKLDDTGDVDQIAKNWVTVDTCMTFIIGKDDEWEDFRMKFTYFAGRFLAVERSSVETEVACIEADAISSAWKTDGRFSCDDRRYEQIYGIVEKAVEANMLSVHTDCPTIERFAWQEPNHLMAPSVFFMKDGRKLWEKFLLDMRTQQHTAEDYFYDHEGNKFYPGDGLMPSQCPCYIPNVVPVPGMGSFYDIIAWGSTCILGTWWHYQFYGDKQVIMDNYDAGMRYLSHLKGRVTDDGFISHGLGDWGNPDGILARENIETAFLYADAVTLAEFARILGKEHDEKELRLYADTVRDNYNRKLLVKNPVTGLYCYRIWDHKEAFLATESGQALPLFWGMVPKEAEKDVVESFRSALGKKQALSAGEISLPYIIQTAAKYGMNDMIADYLLREEHPSYYAFVLDGETTLGEYWEKNPRSHCHDMMGHIVEWYYNGIAGIKILEPGFKRIRLCPYLPRTMKEFRCFYHSVNGRIMVHVREDGDKIRLEAGVPETVAYEIDTCYLEGRGKEVEVTIV